MSNECQEITEAIQELSIKIDQKINALERKIIFLQSQINSLKILVNNHEFRIKKLENIYTLTRTFSSSGSSPSTGSNNVYLIRQIRILNQKMTAIEKYINALDDAGKYIVSSIKNLAKIFNLFKI
ncbi:MAG: hypothetical protein AAF378_08260 [Cyanobacteria bacterium P01_A01_bin.84]